ncbi:unnamed protein product, partial [Schistosoma curassoni]
MIHARLSVSGCGVLMRNRDQWSKSMLSRDKYLHQYNGRWSRNFVDWLRLNTNTVG